MYDYEDLMQEILAQLWRSFGSFRGDSKFETWLYRISINTAISFQRSEIKERKGKERNTSLQSVNASSGGLSHDEILQAFIKELNNIDSAVLMMYIDGLTTHEMESVLGIKANAIKVRVSRLKTKFSEQFVG
jgi:RNA polymerase sigma-70 factor (ECF subfamily)